MRCPECLKTDTPHRVYESGGGAITLMGVHSFWDEDNRHHVHDPNRTTEYIRCSNGHEWTHVTRPMCRVCGVEGY